MYCRSVLEILLRTRRKEFRRWSIFFWLVCFSRSSLALSNPKADNNVANLSAEHDKIQETGQIAKLQSSLNPCTEVNVRYEPMIETLEVGDRDPDSVNSGTLLKYDCEHSEEVSDLVGVGLGNGCASRSAMVSIENYFPYNQLQTINKHTMYLVYCALVHPIQDPRNTRVNSQFKGPWYKSQAMPFLSPFVCLISGGGC
jgi:hypothetical protein